MAVFKKGPMTPDANNGKPMTGGRIKGGYGSGGVPSKAQSRPMGSMQASGTRSAPARKPAGGYGTYGKPRPKMARVTQPMGRYGNDGMAEPKTTIPKDQKTGRFNLPKGKFV